MLPVPEMVPFRLTRDIIDGFGISGCEGTFIRASTFALMVLRQEQDTISTFLDVLKYDPLYNWYLSRVCEVADSRTVSPLKLLSVQQDAQDGPGNKTTSKTETVAESEADRAIQVVKRKLASRLSAEADVRRLILEATDEGNLSRMYCGESVISEVNVKGGPHGHDWD
jgi:serine-protein kinase ATM